MNSPNAIICSDPIPQHMEHFAPETPLPLDNVSARAEYIRTPDAVVFLGAVSEAGLMLSHDAVNELTLEQDRRYGNAYAWLTRSAAAWISSGQEVHSGISIFERQEEVWSKERDDYIHPGPTETSQLVPGGSPGADLLIHLLRQASGAQLTKNRISDIPVSKEVRSMRQDGCKDVEVYFAQAASGSTGENAIETVQIGDKSFWQKHTGAETYINLEQVEYNGVSLPPGCLFRKEDDDGFLFLRVTGLAFDQETAESLFGSAITQWHEMKGGTKDLQKLFSSFQCARDELAKNQHLASR